MQLWSEAVMQRGGDAARQKHVGWAVYKHHAEMDFHTIILKIPSDMFSAKRELKNIDEHRVQSNTMESVIWSDPISLPPTTYSGVTEYFNNTSIC